MNRGPCEQIGRRPPRLCGVALPRRRANAAAAEATTFAITAVLRTLPDNRGPGPATCLVTSSINDFSGKTKMKSRVHAVAGVLGLTLITLFFTSSIVVEIVGDDRAVAAVKTTILFALFVLVPSIMIAGGTGRSMAGKGENAIIRRKKRRMIAIAAIGLLVLVPCAVTLQRLAVGGDLGTAFYVVQVVELVGGAVNISLMCLNVRDGRTLTSGRRVRARKEAVAARS